MRFLASILCVWAIGAASAATSLAPLQQPSVFWDARYATRRDAVLTNIEMRVELPTGEYDGFTCTAWMRIVNTTVSANNFLTTHAFWCPDPVIKTAPDLLAGAGAHGVPGGTNLTDLGGAIAVSNFPFATYEAAHLAPVTNHWKRGVYTLAGWSSNALTVSLGGTDYTCGPGEFNRNAEPGPSESVVITGSGLASIGISRTPCFRYFDQIDGVTAGNEMISGYFITNELTFCVWRFSMEGTNQVYRSDIGTVAAFNETSQIKTNAAPLNGKFSSRGDYKIGLFGIVRQKHYDVELFDTRVLPWCLSNSELERIHFNGVQEINRRGIPQWK